MPTQVKVGWRSFVSPVTSSYLLDTYAGAAAAYSLRKLRTAYTGSAIRVRRSSDNTELNIGFDANGNLDTTSLLAFVGAGNGFVTTWYDQSGNGRDITQTIAANQPKIVNVGSIYRLNGLPSVYFYDNWLYSNLLTMPINNVTNTTVSSSFTTDSLGWGGVNYQSVLSFGGMSEYMGYAAYYTYSNGQFEFNTESRFSNWNGQKTSTSLNRVNLSFNYHGYTQISSWLNSNSFGSSTFSNTNLSTQQYLTIGSRWHGSGFYFHLRGYVSEAIVWNTDKTSNRTQIESNINSYYSIYANDTDAQVFITAASITDSTQVSAIDTLVTQLKTAGIWTKMKAIYPFVGGTATSHKFNLKDPRDLDVAYRLTFSGGWTHTSAGALSNGSNSYADTKLVPSSTLSLNNTHISSYIRDFSASYAGVLLGTNKTSRLWIAPSFSAIYGIFQINNANVTFNSRSGNGGLWLGSRTTSTNEKAFNNGSLHLNITANSTALDDGKIYIAARNDGAIAANYFIGTTAFASIGDGLTDAEALAFYNAVQAFQTTLGRQV